MYEIISNVLKYGFVLIVYMFIYSVIKLIYLDISDTKRLSKSLDNALSYLKLINLRKDFNFKIFESYGIKEVAVIGRSKKCDIYINDPYLSKQNSKIFLKDGKFYIQDLGSTNGTYVNSKKLMEKAVRLKDNDKITIGDINFLFVDTYNTEDLS